MAGPAGYYRTPLRDVPVSGALLGAFLAWLLFRDGGARLPWRRRPRRGAGRYVVDRSLGGRTVFVPAGGSGAAPLASSSSRRAPPPSPSSPGGASPPGGRGPAPAWWAPPPYEGSEPPYAFRADEGLQRARALLGRLEGARAAQGLDAPPELLAELEAACTSHGVSVKPATSNGRDRLVRAAADLALRETAARVGAGGAGGAPLILGDSPAAFASQFARAVECPPEKAWTLVTAAASRQASARLLQCASLLRANDAAAASLELIQLNSLLREFPYSAGSPEAEMVAAGLARQVREPERLRIAELWEGALGADEPNSEAVAGLLGLTR